MWRVSNHNDTTLGEFEELHVALDEARFYKQQTGNAATVEEIYETTMAGSNITPSESVQFKQEQRNNEH